MDALDEQIAAYEGMLPNIKREFGSVWALVAHRELISTFREFSAASRYAREHLAGEQVLIRHTDERPTETAPFVHKGALRPNEPQRVSLVLTDRSTEAAVHDGDQLQSEGARHGHR